MNYLDLKKVLALNQRVLAAEGKQTLVIEQGKLESALMRPMMAAQYEEADLATQAAVLMEGIAQAHGFLDGNKRTALLAGEVFVGINGYTFESPPGEFGRMIEAVVIHQIDLSAFTLWVRTHLKPSSVGNQ
jgi:death-on-curing protein